MNVRQILSAVVLGFSLVSVSPAMAVGETALENELQRLSNIINNNLPERYRDQLNAALDRIYAVSQNQCTSTPRPSLGNPRCEVVKNDSNGYFYVNRDGQAFSSAFSSVQSAAKELESYRNMGVCPKESSALDCDVVKNSSNGYYYVSRNGKLFSSAFSSIQSAVNELNSYRQLDVCSSRSNATTCDVTKNPSNGYYYVTRGNDYFTSAYSSVNSAAQELRTLQNAGLCY